MDDMMDASREFFRQPLEEKQRYTNLIDGEHFQLEGCGNDRVRSEDQILHCSDRLYLKVGPEEERNLALWPTHPKTFRDVLHEFIKCSGVKDTLFPEMAKLMKLNGDYFNSQSGDHADTYARFNYYPKCPEAQIMSNGVFRSPVHRVVTSAEREAIGGPVLLC